MSRESWVVGKRISRRATAVFAIAAWFSACGGDAVIKNAGPVVRVVDSIRLALPEWMTARRGAEPWTRAGDGRVIIGEGGRMAHFAPDGQLMRTIGSAGQGPGEVSRMTGIGFLPGDSLIAVVDVGRSRIVVYDLSTGRMQREVALGRTFVAGQQWRLVGESMVLPVLMEALPFAEWNLASDSVRRWGAEPPVVRDANLLYQSHGEASVAPTDSGWIALYPADPALRLLGSDGGALGAVVLPTRLRLGVPVDAAEVMRAGAMKTPPEFRFVSSMSHAIHRLPSGAYAVIHFDADIAVDDQTLQMTFLNAKYWVSVVSSDLSEACVDGLVPITVEDYHRTQLRGDTLFILTRTITETDDVQTWLRSFVINTDGCDWMPTGGVKQDP